MGRKPWGSVLGSQLSEQQEHLRAALAITRCAGVRPMRRVEHKRAGDAAAVDPQVVGRRVIDGANRFSRSEPGCVFIRLWSPKDEMVRHVVRAADAAGGPIVLADRRRGQRDLGPAMPVAGGHEVRALRVQQREGIGDVAAVDSELSGIALMLLELDDGMAPIAKPRPVSSSTSCSSKNFMTLSRA